MLVHLTGETEGDCRVVGVSIIKVLKVTFYLTERDSSTETIVTKKISDIRNRFRSSDVHVSSETETQGHDEAGLDWNDTLKLIAYALDFPCMNVTVTLKTRIKFDDFTCSKDPGALSSCYID